MKWLRKLFRLPYPGLSRTELVRRYDRQVKINADLAFEIFLAASNHKWTLDHPLSKIAPAQMKRRHARLSESEIIAQTRSILKGEGWGEIAKEVIGMSLDTLKLPQ
jgi:hypothetical protein